MARVWHILHLRCWHKCTVLVQLRPSLAGIGLAHDGREHLDMWCIRHQLVDELIGQFEPGGEAETGYTTCQPRRLIIHNSHLTTLRLHLLRVVECDLYQSLDTKLPGTEYRVFAQKNISSAVSC